jgi:hypothetical protein
MTFDQGDIAGGRDPGQAGAAENSTAVRWLPPDAGLPRARDLNQKAGRYAESVRSWPKAVAFPWG